MKKLAFSALILTLITAAPAFAETGLDTGDTAWVIVSSAFVLLMLPGLALFYSGMVNGRNTLNAMMLSMVALCVIGLQWAIIGFTLAFGPSGSPFIGNLQYVFLGGGFIEELSGTIPLSVFAMFQGMFAIITCALISGAAVERMKFSAYLIFITVWATIVYAPLAHWVWGDGGWLLERGALDFAGGTVVHFSSGTAALALAIVLGKRKGFMKTPQIPHSLPLTLLGAGLLWFGWFGFNAGSALSAGTGAGLAFVNTMVAAAAAGCSWLLVEWYFSKPSALGLASGIVAGLVSITPAAGFVDPWAAIVIGLIGGVVCYYGVKLKFVLKLDDTLDVFGIHGLGGFWGAIGTGIFATQGAKGLILGNPYQVWLQFEGIAAAGIFSFVISLIILYALKAVIGLRVSVEDETEGLDLNQHGEKAYNL